MKNKNRYRFRNVVSLSLFFIILIFIFSGIALYLRPEGSIARWTKWTFLGLDKQGWETVHISCATVFMVIFLCHLFFNYKTLLNYLNIKIASGKTHIREIISAFLLTALVLISALAYWEPVDSVMELRKSIKKGSYLVNVQPPVPNAEDLTIPELATVVNIPLQDIINILNASNYKYLNPKQTLRKIASQNNISIEKLYITIISIQ